jgi:hypothetical protein
MADKQVVRQERFKENFTHKTITEQTKDVMAVSSEKL